MKLDRRVRRSRDGRRLRSKRGRASKARMAPNATWPQRRLHAMKKPGLGRAFPHHVARINRPS